MTAIDNIKSIVCSLEKKKDSLLAEQNALKEILDTNILEGKESSINLTNACNDIYYAFEFISNASRFLNNVIKNNEK